MEVQIRPFVKRSDLELQYQFWTEITRSLPYSWKPTRSPTQYYESEEFSPQSRVFAFDDGQLVGYMSFTAHGKFISLGYPWVRSEYEHIREQLWNKIMTHIEANIEPEMIAQRFRSQWKEQIDFFLDRGFEKGSVQPLYGLELEKHPVTGDQDSVEVREELDVEDYLDYLRGQNWEEEQIGQMKLYYDTVEFDAEIQSGDIRLGLTIRPDNGFAEIIAVPHYTRSDAYQRAIESGASYAKEHGAEVLAITANTHKEIAWLKELGFDHISDDVYVVKSYE